MPPSGYKVLTVKEDTYRLLIVEAGQLQARRGQIVSITAFVNEILLFYKEHGNGDLASGS